MSILDNMLQCPNREYLLQQLYSHDDCFIDNLVRGIQEGELQVKGSVVGILRMTLEN